MWRQFSGIRVMAVRIAGIGSGHRPQLSEAPALICDNGEIGQKFHYWHGASGRRYLHTIYSLVECPAIPMANYVLVARHEDGTRTALRIGQTVSKAGSLNLAHVRQKAALIGANEIHVFALAGKRSERSLIESDLQAGLFSTLSSESHSHIC